MNAVTYCQTVGPAGGDASEKAKNPVCNRRIAQCHHFEPIDPVIYIPVIRSEEAPAFPSICSFLLVRTHLVVCLFSAGPHYLVWPSFMLGCAGPRYLVMLIWPSFVLIRACL